MRLPALLAALLLAASCGGSDSPEPKGTPPHDDGGAGGSGGFVDPTEDEQRHRDSLDASCASLENGCTVDDAHRLCEIFTFLQPTEANAECAKKCVRCQTALDQSCQHAYTECFIAPNPEFDAFQAECDLLDC